MTKMTKNTRNFGGKWVTEYRLDSVYLDLYGKVEDIVDHLYATVAQFPEELRPEVVMDLETDSHYATFTAKGPATKDETTAAKAKDRAARANELARARRQVEALNKTIEMLSKKVDDD